jgi:putrescine importer
MTTSRRDSLQRTLGIWELLILGIILVQPTAPMPLFGVVHQSAKGHVVTAVLISMVAMMFTAVSYGRMARVYPSAGSAYTYVAEEIHPVAGFLTGWSMLLEYVINPVICTIWCAKAAGNFAPVIPERIWDLVFAGLFTFLNLRRVRTTARANAVMAGGMMLVVGWVFVSIAKSLMAQPHLPAGLFTRPFYDPATFTWAGIGSGSALAVLTYIGFDGISTLSEEAENPRRNIPLAMVLICLVVGLLSAAEVYAAQLIWPGTEAFPDNDTAYVYVAARAGGALLFQVVNFTLLIANLGSGAGGQLAGARLLFGMGRDNVLPRGVFGKIHPVTHVPANNVMLIGLACVVGAFSITYEFGAELLNFGAFIGFMGVNIAAFRLAWRTGVRTVGGLVPPVLGSLICFVIWLNLSDKSKWVGAVWLIAGAAYGWWRTNGFKNSIRFDEQLEP